MPEIFEKTKFRDFGRKTYDNTYIYMYCKKIPVNKGLSSLTESILKNKKR